MSIILKSLLIFAIFRLIRGCCINIEDTTQTTPSYPTIKYTIRKPTTKTITTTIMALPSRRTIRTTVKKTTTLTTTTTVTKVRPFTLDDDDVDFGIKCKDWKSEALHSFQVSIYTAFFVLRT